MSRYRASFYHFLISLAVFILLVYLILFEWYPGFFYSIDGGWEGMRIIIGVDLILGPLLTLIVFRTRKPGLKMDLAMIGLFQSICLIAGVYIVYSERPLYFIYYENHFYSTNPDTFERYYLQAPKVESLHAGIPAKIFIRLPDNAIEEADIRKLLYNDGVPLWLYVPLFEPLPEHMDEVMKHGMNPTELVNRDRYQSLEPWLDKYGGELADYAFFPIHSRYRDALIGISKATGEFVDILEIPPPF